MNKEDFFDKITHIVNDARTPDQSKEWSDEFFDEIQKYYRLKCLEAIRNTRYAAIEIVQDYQDSQFDLDRILNCIERDIMNIDNNEVLPNL